MDFLFRLEEKMGNALKPVLVKLTNTPKEKTNTSVLNIKCKLIPVFLRFFTSSPITPINFPLAELRAILICFSLK